VLTRYAGPTALHGGPNGPLLWMLRWVGPRLGWPCFDGGLARWALKGRPSASTPLVAQSAEPSGNAVPKDPRLPRPRTRARWRQTLDNLSCPLDAAPAFWRANHSAASRNR